MIVFCASRRIFLLLLSAIASTATLAVALSLSCAPATAQGAQPGLVVVAPVPMTSDSAVRLHTIIVEADVREEEGRSLALVHATYKLHNDDRAAPASLTVGFPGQLAQGLYFRPAEFEEFTLLVDGDPVALAEPSQEPGWYTWPLTIPPDTTVAVEVNCRQELTGGPALTWRYVLAPALVWPQTVKSARVTVRFPGLRDRERVVAVSPSSMAFTKEGWDWQALDFEPQEDITLTFIALPAWEKVEQARQAVAAAPESAQAHYALGTTYAGLALASQEAREALYPLILDELTRARELDDTGVETHAALATLYRVQADSYQGAERSRYLALAAEEGEKLLQLRAGEEAQWLAQLYRELSEAAQEEGRFAAALDYLERFGQLAGGLTPPELERRRTIYLRWGASLLAEGRAEEAVEVTRTGMGDDFLERAAPVGWPRFSRALLQVQTFADRRQVSLAVTPLFPRLAFPHIENDLAATLGELKARGAEAGLVAVADCYTLTVSIPCQGGSCPAGLAAAVPDRADMALLRAALAPPELHFGTRWGLLTASTFYAESVDLREVAATLEQQARLTAGANPEPGLTPDEAALLTALNGVAVDSWRRLADNSELIYRLDLQPPAGPALKGTWELRPGDVEKLTANESTCRTDRLWPIFCGVVLALTLAFAAGWRAKRGLQSWLNRPGREGNVNPVGSADDGPAIPAEPGPGR
jgi:hypothetical protein